MREAELRIRFVGVLQDSRCPIDVVCVWEGDTHIRLALRDGSAEEQVLELHTAVEPRHATVGGYRIILEAVEPSSRSDRGIGADEYAAILRISQALAP